MGPMAQALAPEARLLLLMARATPEGPERDAAQALLGADFDWDLWLALVERHGLAPLAHRHIETLDCDAVPRAVRARLWARAQSTAHRNEALGRELANVVRILEGAGIGVIPYKGPTLAVRAYGDPGLREFGDLDLLVRARDAVRAKQVLRESGYAPTHDISADQERALVRSSRDYELALVNRAHGTMVELHWRADPDAQLPPLGDESWWASLPRVELSGRSCATLPTEDLLLVLCVHGSKHFWWSLGWLADVVELARREPADWERIHQAAKSHGCVRRLAFAVALARDLLDEDFARGTALPTKHPGVESAARMIRGRLFLREDAELAPMTAFRLHAGLCDGPAKAFALAWRAAFTPGWSEWERWRLPAPLFFLYRVLRPARLLAKYALRLGARKARLPPGLEHRDRDGVGEVQAAIPGTHRQP